TVAWVVSAARLAAPTRLRVTSYITSLPLLLPRDRSNCFTRKAPASMLQRLSFLCLGLAILCGCKQDPPAPAKKVENPPPRPPVERPVVPTPPPEKPRPVELPELGAAQVIQPGIEFRSATLRRGSIPMKVWYHQPEKAEGKLALVLVPPAGSTLFVGMDLSEG